MNKNNEVSILDNKNKKYYVIRNKYLADSMAFLGYTYKKFGYGKETEYSFDDTKEFSNALTKLMELRKEVGVYKEIK